MNRERFYRVSEHQDGWVHVTYIAEPGSVQHESLWTTIPAEDRRAALPPV